MEKNIEVSLLLDFYGELLKPSGREATYLYYNDDLSLSEIAEEVGITRQGVRDSIRRTERQLFSFEEKLGLLSRFRELETGLDDIARTARTIAEQSDSNELSSLAQSIIQRVGELKDNE